MALSLMVMLQMFPPAFYCIHVLKTILQNNELLSLGLFLIKTDIWKYVLTCFLSFSARRLSLPVLLGVVAACGGFGRAPGRRRRFGAAEYGRRTSISSLWNMSDKK